MQCTQYKCNIIIIIIRLGRLLELLQKLTEIESYLKRKQGLYILIEAVNLNIPLLVQLRPA